jgi:iron complex outermembrane receptor protein
MEKIFIITFILFSIFLQSVSYPGEPAGTLRGYVTDAETLEPVHKAVVTINELNIKTITDEKGYFEFLNIEAGTYSVEISAQMYKIMIEKIDFKMNSEINYNFRILPVLFRTPVIVIEENHPRSTFDNLMEMSGVLKEKELQRNLGVTLASTLKNETGLSIRTMGPAPSRPVFRGLSSDRVYISEDGIKTNDLSATSPDHAVTIDPFTIERVEIYRGPKVLLYSPSSIGGVVNVVKNEIPSELPLHVSTNSGVYGESVNMGYLYSLTGLIPYKNFVARGEVTKRQTGDLMTPAGKLKNSSIQSLTISGGLSLIDKFGFAGFSGKEYQLEYGIPGGFVGAHPNGVNIQMKKSQYNARAHIHFDTKAINNLEVTLSRVYYNHKEFESAGITGAEFGITDYNGNAHLDHNKLGVLKDGTLGASFDYRNFTVGGYVFSPPAKSLNLSLFIYENYNLSRKFSFEFSARFNYDNIKPDPKNPNSNIGYISQRIFSTFSFSASGIYQLIPDLYAGVNLSRSSRVPTIEELYSEGPHLAAYSYEIGSPSLSDERGIGAEAFIYYKRKSLYAMAAFFRNDLPYYIIPRNSGQTNYATLLPIYVTQGVGALMYGFETQLELKLITKLSFSGSVSYTSGSFKENGAPLPMIPPFKSLFELTYGNANLLTGVSAELAANQYRVDTYEQPTDGYAVFGAYAQYVLTTGKVVHNLSLNIDNLLNTEYRNHLSRVKSIMPEAGRGLRLTYRLYY